MNDILLSFVPGSAYGLTSVIVGQPMETIKTLTQVKKKNVSILSVIKDLNSKDGLLGFYRGGWPMFIGGTICRSAQFGFYSTSLNFLESNYGKFNIIFELIDPQVILAGFCGGIGRGLVEGPFEYIKVKRQLGIPWKLNELASGIGICTMRDAWLFAFFAFYIDISKKIFDNSLGNFLTGGICANLAWLSIWPLDVIKTQRQSGLYHGKSSFQLLSIAFSTGIAFRGLVPGLLRSFISNGLSLEAYHFVKDKMQSFVE